MTEQELPPSSDPFRARLLEGLVDSITERGYRDTTVADIVRHARTSKRTFYDRFPSKDECLLELLDTDNLAMMATIRTAIDPQAHWRAQIAAAIDAYLGAIEARPAISLTWIREFPALPGARPVQRRGMQRFTDMIVELTAGPGFARAGLAPVSRATALILLGGLRELTAHTVEDGLDVRSVADDAIAACTALLSVTAPSR